MPGSPVVRPTTVSTLLPRDGDPRSFTAPSVERGGRPGPYRGCVEPEARARPHETAGTAAMRKTPVLVTLAAAAVAAGIAIPTALAASGPDPAPTPSVADMPG